MHRLVVVYFDPDDPAHFAQHYDAVHIPLGRQVPGVRSMQYHVGVGNIPGSPPVVSAGRERQAFAAFMADWDSEEAMLEALSSPAGRAVIEDVANYSTGGDLRFHFELR
jgi:uncharacterized protein (TIGR02118 family)